MTNLIFKTMPLRKNNFNTEREREVKETIDGFAEERNLYKVSEDEMGKYIKAYNDFEAVVEKELKIRGGVKEPESMERLEFQLEMTEYDLKMGKENKEPLEDILWYKHEINKLKHAISSLKQESLDKENKSDSFMNKYSEKFMKLRTRLRNKLRTFDRFLKESFVRILLFFFSRLFRIIARHA